jgi:hypothetical protein
MPVERRSTEISKFNSGPYLARIISHLDPKNMGTLQVELLRDVGNMPSRTGNLLTVKYLSPFYGVTGIQHLGGNQSFDDTQKSYGFWMVPPDPGSLVMVIFVEGDPKQGYWIGCVQDEHMNFMIPGLAATELNTENGSAKLPVAEYNKRLNNLEHADSTQIKKPVHPFSKVLQEQGLLEDETRGITTSSARREAPSNVFGISTPGPLDRGPSAPKGTVGKYESKVSGAFVSRLGGTTFVMDDGDDAFVRKTSAGEGPPEYINLEDGQRGGNPNIPHNELVRIRTRTGHQILLHNSEDLIYIGNARGTAWIELTSNGKMDIYCADSVSIHSENDINFTADRDINFRAGQNMNIITGQSFYLTSGANQELKANADGKITVGGSLNMTSSHHIETAGKIDMNGPAAAQAADAKAPGRVPQHEPWGGHENLNPGAASAENTKAGSTESGGSLSKIADTFKKINR